MDHTQGADTLEASAAYRGEGAGRGQAQGHVQEGHPAEWASRNWQNQLCHDHQQVCSHANLDVALQLPGMLVALTLANHFGWSCYHKTTTRATSLSMAFPCGVLNKIFRLEVHYSMHATNALPQTWEVSTSQNTLLLPATSSLYG